MVTKVVVFWLSVSLGALGTQLLAAEEKQEIEPATSFGETQANVLVVTASRTESELSTLSNNTALLDSSILSLISHNHINEALIRIPGSWISRGNGQEHLTAIRSPVFTGPGSCAEFLMMEDGIPLRGTGFCNVNQLFDANTEQAKRIEVVRGANSALYGSNAIHGMINVITPKADSDELGGSLEVGPHDYFRVKRTLTGAYDESQYLFNFNATHDGGYKESSGFEQQKLSLRYSKQVNTWEIDTILSASNLQQQTAGFLQQGEDAYREPIYRRQNDFPEAYRNAQSIRLQSRISGESDALFSWSLTPYMRSNEMDFLMHFLPGQPIENNGHDSFGLMWQAQHQMAKHRLTWGLDFEHTNGRLSQFQPEATDSGSAFLDAVLPQGQHYDYRVDANVAAVYLNWQIALTEKWQLSIANRFDYLKYAYDNRMVAGRTRDDGSECGFGGCRYTRPEDRRDSFDETSSSLSLAHQLSSRSLVYLKLDHAFRAPQATELYRLQNGQQQSEANSEKAKSVELGYRLSLQALFLEANLFSIRKENVIFQNSDREFVSGAKTKHQGLELLSKIKFSDSWDLSSNLTLAEHQYDSDIELQGSGTFLLTDNIIDTAPKHMGSLQLGWQFAEDSRLESEWVHLGSYYTNPDNTKDYGGYDLVNIRIKHQWNETWTSYLKLTNVTDKLYAERADFAFGNDRYFVGEPRSLYLTVEGRL